MCDPTGPKNAGSSYEQYFRVSTAKDMVSRSKNEDTLSATSDVEDSKPLDHILRLCIVALREYTVY
jgi:hypothetical protein